MNGPEDRVVGEEDVTGRVGGGRFVTSSRVLEEAIFPLLDLLCFSETDSWLANAGPAPSEFRGYDSSRMRVIAARCDPASTANKDPFDQFEAVERTRRPVTSSSLGPPPEPCTKKSNQSYIFTVCG